MCDLVFSKHPHAAIPHLWGHFVQYFALDVDWIHIRIILQWNANISRPTSSKLLRLFYFGLQESENHISEYKMISHQPRWLTYTVLQTVARPGVCRAACGIVHYKEPFYSFDKSRDKSRDIAIMSIMGHKAIFTRSLMVRTKHECNTAILHIMRAISRSESVRITCKCMRTNYISNRDIYNTPHSEQCWTFLIRQLLHAFQWQHATRWATLNCFKQTIVHCANSCKQSISLECPSWKWRRKNVSFKLWLYE